jgi:hypothetical protein
MLKLLEDRVESALLEVQGYVGLQSATIRGAFSRPAR